MTRWRAWKLSGLAYVGAAALVTIAPGGATSETPRLATLQRAEAPPLLFPVPNDCMAVGLDFVPPTPAVESHGNQPAAAPSPKSLPVEANARGLSETPTPSIKPQTWPGLKRLPVADSPVRGEPRIAERKPQSLLIDRIEGPPPQQLVQPSTTRLAPVEQPAKRAAAVPARPPMQAVSERALAITQNGARLADRGAHYSAKSEFIQALRMVTQALDAQSGDNTHSQALAEGLRALSEADDFAPAGSKLEADLDLASIIVSHRTPILKETGATTPLAALQQYYGFAGRRLAVAGGQEPAASAALFGLGRLTVVMAERSPDERRLHAPKAMALYQAALVVDSRNARAAHELGVLYAQFGQLEEAKRLLISSATLAPTKETWHNLSIVHDRLGEGELARMARNEVQRMKSITTGAPTTSGVPVEWVDPSRFADSRPHGAGEAPPAVRAAARPAPTIQKNPWVR
jgi:tetratricopeptide (TPR) repeat protein